LKKVKVCFFVPEAYSLFNNKTRYRFGGAELRASIFAKGLARYNDVEVYFITDDYGQFPIQKIENVHMLANLYYRSSQSSSASFSLIFSRIFSGCIKMKYILAKKDRNGYEKYLKEYWMRKTNADYYFLFSTTRQSEEVIDFCNKSKKKFFHFFASDFQVSQTIQLLDKIVTNASKIFVQNVYQQGAINKMRSHGIYLLNNPVQEELIPLQKEKQSKAILWVGKSNEVKNPILFIDLCKLNPDKKFVMVCVKHIPELFDQIKNALPPNVVFYDFLSREAMNKVFSECYILVSTALYEGFPNTFLQAGSNGLPVISTNVNPNNYVTEYQCGAVVDNSITQLNDQLNLIVTDEALYQKLSANHFSYVSEFHDRKKIVQALHDLIVL
jgi:glycosyltransferase involved in cell wall biosynthesis